MSQELGNAVERQGEANKSTTPRTALSFQRKEKVLPWVGFEPTTLCSLGERSTNSGSTTQHKANLEPLYYGTVNSHSVCRSRPG